MSRMETAMERLCTRLTQRTGVLVTLKRGSYSTANVWAVLGRQLLKIVDGEGVPHTILTDKDFLIEREAYEINSVTVEPKRQDRIVEVIDGTTAEYEVLPEGDEKEWRWSDEFRKVYRIHTKRVK